MSLRDDVLDRTDILDLVSKYVQLKKVGKNRAGLCPFHKEKSPSFTVAEDKQIFKCFGCGKGGNAITFHMEIEKTDFRDTIKILAHDAHIDISDYEKDPEQVAAKKESKEKFKLLNKRNQKLFHQALAGSPAEEYLLNTRKLSPETIATFGLGYAPDSHYDLISQLKDKGFSAEDLIQAGLAKQGSNGDIYSFFRHRLTFPIHDHIGNIVGFGARALDKEQNPKYLNTTETPLYDKSKILYGLNIARDHLKERDMLIVVEGYMDVIALHQYGLPIGIATCGTALTAQHTKLISRHTEHLIFAFDNDNAGFEAAIRGLKVAYQQDLFPKILQFPPEYKDVDEWLTSINQQIVPPDKEVDAPKHSEGTSGGLDPKQQKEFLQQNSLDGFTHVLRTLTSQHDLLNPVERKKVLRICFEILQHIEDWTILTLYLDQMSKPFGTGSDILLQQFKGFLKKSRTSNFQPYEEEKQKSGVAPKYLLASLWYDESLIETFSKNEAFSQLQDIIQSLSDHFPSSLIYHITHDTLDDKEKQHLLEAQLRREHQFGDLADEKKLHMLMHFLHQQLHVMERIILKSKKITDEQKQEIIQQVRAVKR